MRTRILSRSTSTQIISRSLDPSSLWHKLRLLILYFRYLSQNKLTTLPRELFHNLKALERLWVGFLWFVLNGNGTFHFFLSRLGLFACHFRFSHGVELNLTWIVRWKTLLFCNCNLQVRTRILSQSTPTQIMSRSFDPSSLWQKLRLLI